MTIFENPFYIIGATTCDDRRKLQILYEKRCLFENERLLENALQTLTNPAKRLSAELKWLAGCDNEREVVEWLKYYETKRSCLIDDVSSIMNDVNEITAINILLTLLPKISSNQLDIVIRKISEYQCKLCSDDLLDTINYKRTNAGFPHILDVAMFDNELKNYTIEISKAIIDKLREYDVQKYRDVVTCFVSDSTHQLIDDIIHDYALIISPRIQQLSERIKKSINVLLRSSMKSMHYDELDRIKQLCAVWRSYMAPLQEHAVVTGSQSLTKEKEDIVYYDLLAESATKLEEQRASQEALYLWEFLYEITPDKGVYKDLRKSIYSKLFSFQSVREERDAVKAEHYRQVALKAWEAEKTQYDKEARIRSEEAAKKEKERIQQKKLELYKQRAQQAWEAEQREYDERERHRSKKAEEQEKVHRAEIKEAIKRRERRTLQAHKKALQEKRKALGIFSTKEKKKLDNELTDVDRKLEAYR